jgi:hypothetical protein
MLAMKHSYGSVCYFLFLLQSSRKIPVSKKCPSYFVRVPKQAFHKEKLDVLRTGLTHSSYIQTDDTGARHKGKNGYCTHIGNPFFAYFASRNSKSRVNFLELLRADFEDYVLN